MIQCPKCAHQLPDWAQTCQFCQTDVKGVARPKSDPKMMRPAMSGPAPWIWPTYYVISAYFLLDGIVDITHSLVLMAHPKDAFGGSSFTAIVGIIVGSLTAIIGIGLIAKVEIIRGIVNIFCWLRIGVGLLSMPANIGLAIILGPLGIVLVLMSILGIICAGLMIYLIGETD